MGVNHQHPDYVKWSPIWKKCRDAKSQELVHAAGQEYLPVLADETGTAYNARKKRALYYTAYARAVQGLVGMLFRKQPAYSDAAETAEEILADATLSGVSFTELMETGATDAIEVYRFGIMTDYPVVGEGKTLADVKDLRPSSNIYKAESIINWKTTRIGGKQILSKVVLSESRADAKDEWEDTTTEQFRVLDLFEGFYRVRVFEVQEGQDVQIGLDYFPLMNNQKQTTIRFEIFPSVGISPPPLLGMVNVNLSHYMTTADYEQGCSLSGRPTLFITGYTPKEGTSIYIGGAMAQCIPQPEAKAFFLEVTSKFEALRLNLGEKELKMAVLGSRMLEQQKKGAETAEAAGLHRVGESSALSVISSQLSKTFSRVLKHLLNWDGKNGDEASVTINKDFVSASITPQLFDAMLRAVQASQMSGEAFFYNLKQGELYPNSVTWEEEQTRIGNQSPPAPE